MRENRILGCLVMREKWMDFGEAQLFSPCPSSIDAIGVINYPQSMGFGWFKKNK